MTTNKQRRMCFHGVNCKGIEANSQKRCYFKHTCRFGQKCNKFEKENIVCRYIHECPFMVNCKFGIEKCKYLHTENREDSPFYKRQYPTHSSPPPQLTSHTSPSTTPTNNPSPSSPALTPTPTPANSPDKVTESSDEVVHPHLSKEHITHSHTTSPSISNPSLSLKKDIDNVTSTNNSSNNSQSSLVSPVQNHDPVGQLPISALSIDSLGVRLQCKYLDEFPVKGQPITYESYSQFQCHPHFVCFLAHYFDMKVEKVSRPIKKCWECVINGFNTCHHQMDPNEWEDRLYECGDITKDDYQLLSTINQRWIKYIQDIPCELDDNFKQPRISCCDKDLKPTDFANCDIGIVNIDPVNMEHLALNKTGSNVSKTFQNLRSVMKDRWGQYKYYITDIFPFVNHSKLGVPGSGYRLMEQQAKKIVNSYPKVLILCGEVVHKLFRHFFNISPSQIFYYLPAGSTKILVVETYHFSRINVGDRRDFFKSQLDEIVRYLKGQYSDFPQKLHYSSRTDTGHKKYSSPIRKDICDIRKSIEKKTQFRMNEVAKVSTPNHSNYCKNYKNSPSDPSSYECVKFPGSETVHYSKKQYFNTGKGLVQVNSPLCNSNTGIHHLHPYIPGEKLCDKCQRSRQQFTPTQEMNNLLQQFESKMNI